jgi:hypothetical protein
MECSNQPLLSNNMKYLLLKDKILFFAILMLVSTNLLKAQGSPLVSAFFGLDNAMPIQANLLCPGALGMDGMPLNFIFPIDGASLSASDFEVVDSLGNIHIPMCAVLAPANENGENRTVLLIGEFGTANTNPPVEVRVVDDLFTTDPLSGESTCSESINLNGIFTTNVVPLNEGPSLFFAQRIDGSLNECSSGTQTIQVAWNGGITPYISGDMESDLFQYYIGYSDSSGVLIPHVPISIADLSDNDNFHQLCFSTSDEIVKISMMANTVEDPNQDPNLYSEIDVTFCDNVMSVEDNSFEKGYKIYPNPFFDEIFIENLLGDEYFIIYDFLGRKIIEGKCFGTISLSEAKQGTYYLNIINNTSQATYKIIKQ